MIDNDMKDIIILETIRLIEKCGNKPESINFREICANLNISLGLINYHFGTKKNLVNACVGKMIDGIVSTFERIRDGINDLPPYEKLNSLSAMTLDYLFNHSNLSKMSINLDVSNPTILDNTSHTVKAYIPIIKLCKPSLSDIQIQMLTYRLVFTMQNVFTRAEVINKDLNINLFDKTERDKFHSQMLWEIMNA